MHDKYHDQPNHTFLEKFEHIFKKCLEEHAALLLNFLGYVAFSLLSEIPFEITVISSMHHYFDTIVKHDLVYIQ